MPVLSIIIPIYNTAKHIKRSLDCVLKQSMQDLELILVDDGSTDNSYEICTEYAKCDKRIKLIKQENQGVSSARNTGLDNATGKFIFFFDSDDTMASNMAEDLIQLIDTHDIAISGVCKMSEDGKILNSLPKETIYQVTCWEAIASMYKDKYYSYQGFLWNKLYRRDIIEQNSIRFHKELLYNEDRTFNIEYLLYCKTAIIITKPYYYYTIWQGGAMSKNDPEKKWTAFVAFEIQKRDLKNAPLAIKRLLAQNYVKDVIIFAESYPQYMSKCKKVIENNIWLLKPKMMISACFFLYLPTIYKKRTTIRQIISKLKN